MKWRWIPALLIGLALGTRATAQSVWLVDGAPGPGVDFTDLQTAFDTAQDGDVLVLRAKFGGYAGATLFQKGLTLIADSGADVRIQSMSVRQLGVQQRVVIANIDFWNTTLGPESGLNLRNSAGTVWLQDCELRGRQGWPVPGPGGGLIGSDAEPGLDIWNVAAVSVARCTIRGGDGFQVFREGAPSGVGGDAIRHRGVSFLSVHNSTLIGGMGGGVDADTVGYDGSRGGFGLDLEGGSAQVIGCHVQGGAGGQGGATFDPFTGVFLCGAGGAGGDAIGNRSTLAVLVPVQVGSSTLLPSVGGSGCGPGAPGVALDTNQLQVTQLMTSPLATTFATPHFEGQALSFTADGPAGSFALLAYSKAPSLQTVPGLEGQVLLDPNSVQLVSLGLLPATLNWTAPSVATVGGALSIYAQLVVLDPLSSVVTLGEPTFAIVLDQAAY